jgi:hypothetical protein
LGLLNDGMFGIYNDENSSEGGKSQWGLWEAIKKARSGLVSEREDGVERLFALVDDAERSARKPLYICTSRPPTSCEGMQPLTLAYWAAQPIGHRTASTVVQDSSRSKAVQDDIWLEKVAPICELCQLERWAPTLFDASTWPRIAALVKNDAVVVR